MRAILLLSLFPQFAFAQLFNVLSNKHAVYSNRYQFSSMVFYNGSFLLPAERCDSLIRISAQGEYITGYPLHNGPVQIEGAALYDHYIFLIDESAGVQKRIYVHDLENMQLVNSIALPEFVITDDSMGLEGLAINSTKKICYVLQEKNERGKSVIKQYKIKQSEGKFELRYQVGKDIIIPHTSGITNVKNQRYCDLFFHNDSLFLLGSYFFGRRDDRNQYFIDVLPSLDEEGLIKSVSGHPTLNHRFIDLSKEMKTFNKTYGGDFYSTNLEGITMANGSFFLVADNAQSSNDMCDSQTIGSDRTLLLKLSTSVVNR